MMTDDPLAGRKIILASQSPRRQYLLKELGFNFEVTEIDVREVYPAGLSASEIAVYLAELKSSAFEDSGLNENSILITADTIVVLGQEILGKPTNYSKHMTCFRNFRGVNMM